MSTSGTAGTLFEQVSESLKIKLDAYVKEHGVNAAFEGVQEILKQTWTEYLAKGYTKIQVYRALSNVLHPDKKVIYLNQQRNLTFYDSLDKIALKSGKDYIAYFQFVSDESFKNPEVQNENDPARELNDKTANMFNLANEVCIAMLSAQSDRSPPELIQEKIDAFESILESIANHIAALKKMATNMEEGSNWTAELKRDLLSDVECLEEQLQEQTDILISGKESLEGFQRLLRKRAELEELEKQGELEEPEEPEEPEKLGDSNEPVEIHNAGPRLNNLDKSKSEDRNKEPIKSTISTLNNEIKRAQQEILDLLDQLAQESSKINEHSILDQIDILISLIEYNIQALKENQKELTGKDAVDLEKNINQQERDLENLQKNYSREKNLINGHNRVKDILGEKTTWGSYQNAEGMEEIVFTIPEDVLLVNLEAFKRALKISEIPYKVKKDENGELAHISIKPKYLRKIGKEDLDFKKIYADCKTEIKNEIKNERADAQKAALEKAALLSKKNKPAPLEENVSLPPKKRGVRFTDNVDVQRIDRLDSKSLPKDERVSYTKPEKSTHISLEEARLINDRRDHKEPIPSPKSSGNPPSFSPQAPAESLNLSGSTKLLIDKLKGSLEGGGTPKAEFPGGPAPTSSAFLFHSPPGKAQPKPKDDFASKLNGAQTIDALITLFSAQDKILSTRGEDVKDRMINALKSAKKNSNFNFDASTSLLFTSQHNIREKVQAVYAQESQMQNNMRKGYR